MIYEAYFKDKYINRKYITIARSELLQISIRYEIDTCIFKKYIIYVILPLKISNQGTFFEV